MTRQTRSPARWPAAVVLLHWAMAATLAAMLAGGLVITRAAERAVPRKGSRLMWTKIIGAAALLLAGAPSASESDWKVDHPKSRLGYAVEIGDATVTGRFDGWTAEIAFDPSRPEEGRVRVEIDMNTVSIDDARAQAVVDAAWLGVEAHPTAVFLSDRFDLAPDGALTVTGWLTLKGVKAPMTLTGALILEGAEAAADLSGAIARLSHNVGAGQNAVAAEVMVQTKLTAHRVLAD